MKMDIDTFEQTVAAAIDAAEAERLKKTAPKRAGTIATIRFRGYPSDVAGSILGSIGTAFAKDIGEAVKGEKPERIAGLLAKFDGDLLEAVQRERASGRLRLPTNGVDERLDELHKYGKGAAEIASLRLMITAADPLNLVDFFFVTTKSGRRITVDDLRAYGQPAGWSNDSSWRSRFVIDERLREMEADATARAQAATPVYGRNLDFVGGVRPQGYGQ
jgi:hypothetical protein